MTTALMENLLEGGRHKKQLQKQLATQEDDQGWCLAADGFAPEQMDDEDESVEVDGFGDLDVDDEEEEEEELEQDDEQDDGETIPKKTEFFGGQVV